MRDKNSGKERERNKIMRDIQGSVKAEYKKGRERDKAWIDREICTQKRNKVDNIIGRILWNLMIALLWWENGIQWLSYSIIITAITITMIIIIMVIYYNNDTLWLLIVHERFLLWQCQQSFDLFHPKPHLSTWFKKLN